MSRAAGVRSGWPDGTVAQRMTFLEVCRFSGGAMKEGCGWMKAREPGGRRRLSLVQSGILSGLVSGYIGLCLALSQVNMGAPGSLLEVLWGKAPVCIDSKPFPGTRKGGGCLNHGCPRSTGLR